MSTHLDLLRLLRAELAREAVLELADHLDSCAECRAELAELAVGHALLARTAHTLREAPPPASAPPGVAVPLPPLRRRPRAPWQKRRGPLLLVAAAVTAVALGATALTVGVRGDSSGPTAGPDPDATVSTRLDPVGGSAHGTVRMTHPDSRSTRMTISAADLPEAGRGHFYEAWLLDPTTLKMLPLGQIGPSRQASFEVADRLLSRYRAIDVSLEADDGDPQHSVTSVLRASYDPTSRSRS